MAAVRQISLIKLRPMQRDDVTEVMKIEEKIYDYPWTKGIFMDCIRVGYECWVARLNDSIIGYMVFSIGAGESHVLNLGVDLAHQGGGVGRHMLGHIIDTARIRLVDTILLEVRPSNHAAIHLYLSSGFNEIGRRKAYYPSTEGKEDALLFALAL